MREVLDKLKVVFMGGGRFGLPCLEAIAASGAALPLVVTVDPRPAGRGRHLAATCIAQWAARNAVDCLESDDINKPQAAERIEAVCPDVIVVVAFGQMISNRIIQTPPKGTINVHASLLPRYRGAAPINWAIIRGDKVTGVTIATVTEKMDAGLVLGQLATEIDPRQTAGQLHDVLAALAPPLLIEVLESLCLDRARYTRQDQQAVTMAPKLCKADGFIDFSDAAADLDRCIRGLSPWPGVSAVYRDKSNSRSEQVIIVTAEPVERSAGTDVPCGTLDDRLHVVCGRGALRILALKPAGKGLMDFESFVRGRRCLPGDRFVQVKQVHDKRR